MNRMLCASLVATAVLAGGFAAAAPPTTAPAGAAAAPAGKMRRHDSAADVEKRIAILHQQLQITQAQQPQWDQFAQVMRENAKDMEDTFKSRAASLPVMTASQNMQSYADVASNHARQVAKLVPAFQALYDSMPDSQKLIADKVFRAEGAAARARRG